MDRPELTSYGRMVDAMCALVDEWPEEYQPWIMRPDRPPTGRIIDRLQADEQQRALITRNGGNRRCALSGRSVPMTCSRCKGTGEIRFMNMHPEDYEPPKSCPDCTPDPEGEGSERWLIRKHPRTGVMVQGPDTANVEVVRSSLADRYRQERDEALRREEFTHKWWATRFERIKDEVKNTDLWPAIASIMANGTAEITEPPTYAQMLNAAQYRAEAAEAEVQRLREALERIAIARAIPIDTQLGAIARQLDRIENRLDKAA